MSFKGKVVIVTGASSGIGAAAAVAFSNEGAKVVIVGRNEAKLASVAARCAGALVVRADVSKDDEAKRVVDETIRKFNQLDILVNNAGALAMGSILSGDIMKAYDDVMNINLRAVVRLTALAAPHLIKEKGNIINISSIAGQCVPANPMAMMYSVSKAAVDHFGANAASELAPHGVRVNTISPGPVVTDILESAEFPSSWDNFKKQTALYRVSEPEEIADLILFLASDKAKGITGSNYVSDNGMVLCGKC